MRLKLEPDVSIPFGTVKRFMQRYDDLFIGKEEEISDFEIPIKYPPVDYDGEIRWGEMSYNRFTDRTLSWNWDTYSCGEW